MHDSDAGPVFRVSRPTDESHSSLSERVAALADTFVQDVVRLVREASLGEMADAMAALQGSPAARVSREPRDNRLAPRRANGTTTSDDTAEAGRLKRSKEATEARGRTRGGRVLLESSPPGSPRSPFDITMPGPLLDAAAEAVQHDSVRDLDSAPVSSRRARPSESTLLSSPEPHADRSPPESGSVPVTQQDQAPRLEEKPPSIVLREGEQLVRANRSGVIIRRVRGV